MQFTHSTDGTRIAFELYGHGEPLVLVLGALNNHTTGVSLARWLSRHFTVCNYDRRGRGESGDNPSYSVQREIDDLAAVIAHVGGSAHVLGYSAGAILSLRAAAQDIGIKRLALYEPPPPGGDTVRVAPQLSALMQAGKPGAAVELFQSEVLGMSAQLVADIRDTPFRPELEKMAHTMAYESAILEPWGRDVTSRVQIPTLIMDGDQSPPSMRESARTLAATLPHAQRVSLPGQNHHMVPNHVGPVVTAFLEDRETVSGYSGSH